MPVVEVFFPQKLSLCFVMLGRDYANSISALVTGALLCLDNSGQQRETKCLEEK